MGINTHSFNVELAALIGLEQAIILQHFYHWHLSNLDNEDMFKDGNVWFFTSRRNILQVFPYLTERKVRTAIEGLEKSGYIIKGNYNPDKMKKTNWYALTEKAICLFSSNALVKMTNDWSKRPTEDILNKDIEKESISKDIPKKEILLNSHTIQDNPFGEKEKSSAKKKDKQLPFDSEELSNLWAELVKYPEWQKKTSHAIELRIRTLERLSKGDVNYAIAIVRQTLEKGWLDFYAVKDYKPQAPTMMHPRKKAPWEEMGISYEKYMEFMKH